MVQEPAPKRRRRKPAVEELPAEPEYMPEYSEETPYDAEEEQPKRRGRRSRSEDEMSGGIGAYLMTGPTPTLQFSMAKNRWKLKKLATMKKRGVSPYDVELMQSLRGKSWMPGGGKRFGSPFLTFDETLKGIGADPTDAGAVDAGVMERAKEAYDNYVALIESARSITPDDATLGKLRQDIYDLQQTYILNECAAQGVDIPGNLVPTNPNHAVPIAVRGDMKRTIGDIDRIKSIEVNQRKMVELKAAPWFSLVSSSAAKAAGDAMDLIKYAPYALAGLAGIWLISKFKD